MELPKQRSFHFRHCQVEAPKLGQERLWRLACLGYREPSQLHQLINGEGAGAHELLVKGGGSFRR